MKSKLKITLLWCIKYSLITFAVFLYIIGAILSPLMFIGIVSHHIAKNFHEEFDYVWGKHVLRK